MTPTRSIAIAAAALLTSSSALGQESRPAASQPADAANPAAEGFNHEGSDAKAIEIADATMKAMGGRAAWDATRYITWKFFDFRTHIWDKHSGDIRVEFTNRDGVHHVLLSNLHTGKGKAAIDGKPVTDEEELAGLMENAKSAWINDAYWIVMPYKLKDSGVTLTYVGEEAMENGREADVLQLVFEGVGNTPENKYRVWVAKDSGLVEQWSFYRTAADEEPGIVNAWHNWKTYGDIMLSDDRGEMRGNPTRHTGVAVYDTLPRSVFQSAEPIDWSAIPGSKATSMNTPLDNLKPLLGDWTGTLAIYGPDGEVTFELGISWHSAYSFNGRHLRFEFSSLEPRGDGGYAEFVGLFTMGADGETIESLWVNPRIRQQEDRFLNGQTIFFEKGTFDSTGTVLTLIAEKQYGPDQPVVRVQSVFTLDGPNRFTVVDSAWNEDTQTWIQETLFDLSRD